METDPARKSNTGSPGPNPDAPEIGHLNWFEHQALCRGK